MELYEFKFYQSYTEIFDRLSDEDSGKLIKRMQNFYFRGDDTQSESVIVEVVFSQIKYTMEKSIQGKATGAKRTTTPTTTPSTVPSTTPTTTRTTKDKEQDKEQDNVKDNVIISDDTLATVPLLNNSFRKELIETIKRKETQKQTVTEMAIILFEDFGYQYQKDETFHSLRDWFVTLSNMHAKKGDEMGKVLFNWHTYWKGQKENKQPKDCKASFSKNPFLTSKFDKNENK